MEKRAIVVLCIILFLIPISVFGIFSAVKYGYALFMFDNADTYYKSKFDNPVINADYSGWEPYYFNDGRSMFFPDSWIISEDDGIYYITEENTLLGWGGYIGTDTAYSTKSELVQAALGYQTASSTCLHIRDNFAVYHAKYNGYEYTDGVQNSEFLTLEIQKNRDNKYVFFFPSTNQVSQYMNADIAEAIIYSYYELQTERNASETA